MSVIPSFSLSAPSSLSVPCAPCGGSSFQMMGAITLPDINVGVAVSLPSFSVSLPNFPVSPFFLLSVSLPMLTLPSVSLSITMPSITIPSIPNFSIIPNISVSIPNISVSIPIPNVSVSIPIPNLMLPNISMNVEIPDIGLIAEEMALSYIKKVMAILKIPDINIAIGPPSIGVSIDFPTLDIGLGVVGVNLSDTSTIMSNPLCIKMAVGLSIPEIEGVITMPEAIVSGPVLQQAQGMV